jgi:hypothetical protein
VIIYAAEKIKSTENVKVKYAITELITPLILKYSSKYGQVTPNTVIELANTITSHCT